MKIELHKQFKVPIDGLIPLAETITLKKEKKADENKPFQKVEKKQQYTSMLGGSPAAASPRELADAEADDEAEAEAEGAEPNEKKAHKKAVKAEQREKRKMKKQLKNAFMTSIQSEIVINTTAMGGLRKGVSVKKIY